MSLNVHIKAKTYPSRTPGQDHVALADVKFSVPEGQFTCIVGPSGCGKTTLLNIVSGLEGEVEGLVTMNGGGPKDAHIGYMFQTPRLMPWLSVVDNVRLVLEEGAQGNSDLAESLLKEMHLEDVMDAFPNRLSGGMQRRVALARAFAVKPQLMLLDEPFISLDEPVAVRLRKFLLAQWRERPTTVLFVTHNLNEALFLADRILFLSPSPGSVVLDFPVLLPRPRAALDAEEIEKLRDQLLEEYPDLLTGLIGGTGNGAEDDHGDEMLI